jgi:catechol 2,3-dioxygenase-like lactoylglutathione lyase family enzyme
MLDHVILTISDFTRSVPFYSAALRPLGVDQYIEFDGENGHPDLKGFGRDGKFFLWLKEGTPDPSAVHVGFMAQSQAAVRAGFAAALVAGGREKVAPSARLEYGPNYFAAWVLDPDGHDIEIVNKTGRVT